MKSIVRDADLLCCILFGSCSCAGIVWFYLDAIGPVLRAW